MSYHSLSECSLTDDELRAEATRIVEILADFTEQLRPNERNLVERMGDEYATVSVAQLFYLRDIRDRVI